MIFKIYEPKRFKKVWLSVDNCITLPLKKIMKMAEENKRKRALVVGATSGIGKQVAILLSHSGYDVAVAGRREELLRQMKADNDGIIDYEVIDVNSADAANGFDKVVSRIGGIDLYFHSSGIGYQNPELDMEKELRTVATNGMGFTRMVGHAFHYFAATGGGQIAVITSIARTKGLGAAPSYSATKRYQSNYLEALQQLAKMKSLDICVTDIRPGFVATDLLGDGSSYPMKLSADSVARQIVKTVLKRRRVVTIDWRYAILVFFWRLVPRFIWTNLGNISTKK